MFTIKGQNDALQILVGQKLQYVRRSCELVDFGFGQMFSRTNSRGNKSEVASYSLHVLCPFRITNADSVLYGSNDLYIPLSEMDSTVDLNIKNSCVFDSKVDYYQKNYFNELVQEVTISKYGDVNLLLSNICICLFNDSSSADEAWRFFKTGEDVPHLICSGLGVEFE